MEKTVSRNDLQSPICSSEPPSDPAAIERFKDSAELEFVEHDPTIEEHLAQSPESEQLDFQLFAASTPSATVVNKIRLRSPTPGCAEGGFINPKRISEYYFTYSPGPEEKRKFEVAAVSGEDVLARSRQPLLGGRYSRKVLHLPISSLTHAAQIQAAALWPRLVSDSAERKRRTRPGKKYRIRIRTKLAAAKARQEAKKAADDAKNAAEREKRNKRNREKKIKRRDKERAKKAAAAKEVADPSGHRNDQDG
ncbi:hypothetical protein M433DRAFT_27928 [Acidomyces richmondensis BFW]|nr:MAG: hypothetical protein FE78DRAFT_34373 [Acidomyces sp. 'richmondensis']KYG40911.1 hypothetical protein M433DRAFT_27928 [Acidomyces richmondensis BFW]